MNEIINAVKMGIQEAEIMTSLSPSQAQKVLNKLNLTAYKRQPKISVANGRTYIYFSKKW